MGLHLVVILIDRLDVLALHQHGARTSGGDDGCKIINAKINRHESFALLLHHFSFQSQFQRLICQRLPRTSEQLEPASAFLWCIRACPYSAAVLFSGA